MGCEEWSVADVRGRGAGGLLGHSVPGYQLVVEWGGEGRSKMPMAQPGRPRLGKGLRPFLSPVLVLW